MDGIGAVGPYGQYNIELRENTISDRASVLEENGIKFVQDSHGIVAGRPVPPGYRACWRKRNTLAAAKLHSRLDSGTNAGHFPRILLDPGTGNDDDDFVEVHIYGPINRWSIQRVIGPSPSNRADKVLWRAVEHHLKEVGATLEVAI